MPQHRAVGWLLDGHEGVGRQVQDGVRAAEPQTRPKPLERKLLRGESDVSIEL
jgi:hypothetical protein